MRTCLLVTVCCAVVCFVGAGVASAQFINALQVPGETTDLLEGATSQNDNRLSFGSGMAYDPTEDVFWGVPDRGPTGGLLPWDARVQKFNVDIDPVTMEISNFQLLETIKLKTADGSQTFNGLYPELEHGNNTELGLSFDPEGLAISPINGHFFIPDEYGPAIYEFERVEVNGVTEGRLVQAFNVPEIYTPRNADGTPNYDPTIKPELGRQKSRGFEGVAISPDGVTLTAIMQDPLEEDGGRQGRNVRMPQFDVATGECTRQLVYQLEDIADINARIPGEDMDYEGKDQGKSIVVSDLALLPNGNMVVLERDKRGFGTDDPTGTDPELTLVGTKRLYEIDLAAATDVSDLMFGDDPTGLPEGVVPVSKTLLVDIHAGLSGAGLQSPEKMEGIAIVPANDSSGKYLALISSDNDFSSITDDEGTTLHAQYDLYTDGTTGPFGEDPAGRTLLSSNIYAFAVPEPGTVSMLIGALMTLGAVMFTRRRRG